MIFDKIFTGHQVDAARKTGVENIPAFLTYGFGRHPIAGVPVDGVNAFRYSAVWRAVCVISQAIAGLPWDIVETDGDKTTLHKNNPVYAILNGPPNEETKQFSFRQTLVSHALTNGNGFAEIERNMMGRPVALHQISYDRVQVKRDSKGKLVYEVSNGMRGSTVTLAPRHMFHIQGPAYDGLEGFSLVDLASESISLGLALQHYGAAFFGNGATMGGILTSEGGQPNPEQAKQMRDELEKLHKGARNAHKLGIFGNLKYQPIGVEPEKAQFVDTRDFEITEAARWFGVPPHKLGKLSDATFSNIEQQNREFAQESLLPWAKILQQEADMKLLSEDDRGKNLSTRMDLKELIKADSKTRSEVSEREFRNGITSINEWRQSEGMNDIGPDGDLRLVPMNMVSVREAAKTGNTADKPKA